MVLHVNKKGIRVLGIAESFRRDHEKSVLAGVVMRSDFIIDGFAFTRITVGGMDATEGIFRIFESLQRDDINLMMLNGCVISWFNIINIEEIYERLGKHFPSQFADSLEEAVAICFEAARPGETVLLSPACASFDMFNSFEHRGEVFKQIVNALKTGSPANGTLSNG